VETSTSSIATSASAFSTCNTLTNIVLRNPEGTTFPGSAFLHLAPGATFWYYGRKAPASITKWALRPVDSAYPHYRVYVRNGADADGWRALATRYGDLLTAGDKARTDYPGDRRTIGLLLPSNSDRAWFIAWSDKIGSVLMMR